MYRAHQLAARLTLTAARSRPHTDRGATSVEYGLMVTLIAVVVIGSVALFGRRVSDLFFIPASVI